MWGRILAEAVQRGEVRNQAGRESLELLVRASAQSTACAEMIREWILGELTDEIRKLGVSEPELRARAFATVMFGTTFTSEILELESLAKGKARAQMKIRAGVLQAILAADL